MEKILSFDGTWIWLLWVLFLTGLWPWTLSMAHLVQFRQESCWFGFEKILHSWYLLKLLILHTWYLTSLARPQQESWWVGLASIFLGSKFPLRHFPSSDDLPAPWLSILTFPYCVWSWAWSLSPRIKLIVAVPLNKIGLTVFNWYGQ